MRDSLGSSEWIGGVWVGVVLFSAFGMRWSAKLDKSDIWKVLLVTGLPILVATLVFNGWVLLSGFWIHEIGRGAIGLVLKKWLNGKIKNDRVRSSINSIRSSVATAGNAVGLVVSGVMAEAGSPLLVWVVFSSVMVGISLWVWRDKRWVD